MNNTEWVFAFASSKGNAHISANIPCQDTCSVEIFDNFSISIVSDGAGSCINSDKGSKVVVDFCNYHFSKLIKQYKWNDKTDLPSRDLWHKTAKFALNNVFDDLNKYSITEKLEFKSLSCTVIVIIALDSGLLVTHIGDGRAGYCTQDLEWKPLISPFKGELANQTVFITSEIWDEEIIDNYIESDVVSGQIYAYCLLTDGCEKASFECNLFDSDTQCYYDPNRPFGAFFNPNIKILIKLFQDGKNQDDINELWNAFLTSGNEKLKIEPDDKTMILAVKKVDINKTEVIIDVKDNHP